ncbi:MAG: GntR family transcriptional regulator [Chloroflexota bacterium]
MAKYPELHELDKSIPVPLYYQLKSYFLKEIESGNLCLGDRIPTEDELHENLRLSRSTIRHAITELVQEGWLERRKSKGTYVIRTSKSPVIFRSFEPFYQSVKLYGKTPRTEVIDLSVITANNKLAESMNLAVGEKVITMFRRRFINEEPVVTIQNYLPFSLCEFVLERDFSTASLYETFMQNPLTRIDKTTTIISSQKATAEDAKLLNVELDCPMLVFNTISHTAQKKIIDFAYSHYRGDLNRFEIESSPQNYR